MKQVTFLGELCNVHTNHVYNNNRQVIELEIAETGEPMCVATVNIPDVHLEKDEVIIKDYSENEGIFEILLNAGIIKDTGKRAQTTFVQCPIAKLVDIMKQQEVKVRFYIDGVVTVNANTRKEAKEIINRDLGLCLGGNIHTSTNDVDDWVFPIHFEKQFKK